MKLTHNIFVLSSLFAFSASGMAQVDEHKDHHPSTVVAPISTPAKTVANENSAAMVSMDKQMKRMQDMHVKMINAKSPNEHDATMKEQMKVMQEGMDMMNKMSSQDMSGMMMKEGMKMKDGMNMKNGMAENHQMMMKRMEMMQAMMQMMMDRLAPHPLKK
jgi:hypothetical protein